MPQVIRTQGRHRTSGLLQKRAQLLTMFFRNLRCSVSTAKWNPWIERTPDCVITLKVLLYSNVFDWLHNSRTMRFAYAHQFPKSWMLHCWGHHLSNGSLQCLSDRPSTFFVQPHWNVVCVSLCLDLSAVRLPDHVTYSICLRSEIGYFQNISPHRILVGQPSWVCITDYESL